MDNNSRRYGATANSSSSQLLRPSCNNNGSSNGGSFIPTAAAGAASGSVSSSSGPHQSHLHHNSSNHHGHTQGQNHIHHTSSSSSKLAQQLALQSQLQAQALSHIQLPSSTATANSTMHQHNHIHHHQSQLNSNNAQNHYYQNLPVSNRSSAGLTSRNSMPNHIGIASASAAAGGSSSSGGVDHHLNNHSHQHQMLHSRSSTQQQQQHLQLQLSHNNGNYIMTQPHYGNTTHNNHNHMQTNNGGFYGTLTQHSQQSTKGIPIIMSINNGNNGNNHPQPPALPNAPSNLLSIQPVIQQIQQQHLSTQISQQIQQQQPGEILQEGGQLPQTLVESMRTLFDILDDSKQGKVRLSDIESRWENHSVTSAAANENGPVNGLKGNTGAEPLIKMGVLGYLRRVTPPDGMLTFDRFCAGLKLALLTNNVGNGPQYDNQHSQYGSTTNQVGPLDHSSHNNYRQHQQETANRLLSAPKTVAIQQQMNGGIPNMQRQSKIPGIAASRLPMAANAGNGGSGIPISPNARYGNSSVMYQNAVIKRNTVPGNGAEQCTTVALVHQPPAPNPKPTSKIKSTIEAIEKGTSSFLGKNKHNYMTKNGSLDNLKSDEPIIVNGNDSIHIGNGKGRAMKDRPPSAPILDLDDDTGCGNTGTSRCNGGSNIPRNTSAVEFYSSTNTNNNSIPCNRNNNTNSNNSSNNSTRLQKGNNGNSKKTKSDSTSLSIGKRVVNFVTPRQRTLSMPQLQFNKLKSTSKSINIEEGTPTMSSSNSTLSPSTSSHSPSIPSSNPAGDDTVLSKSQSSIPKSSKSTPSKLNFLNSKSQLIPPSFILSSLSKQKSSEGPKGVMNSEHQERRSNNANLSSSKESTLDSSNASDSTQNMYPPAPPKPPRNHTSFIPNGSCPTAINAATTVIPNSADSMMLVNGGSTCSSTTGSAVTPTKPEIRNVLQSWQKGIITGTSANPEKKPLTISKSVGVISTNANLSSFNKKNVGGVSSGSEEILNELEVVRCATTGDPVKGKNGDKKSSQRRRETPRRHTVQSGIDFTTLKRLKQLEQERDVLQQGVSYIETTREWYSKQLEVVEEKIDLLTKGAPTSDYWSESHEERLNLLGCRVSEVNSLLTALMDGSSSLPLHMNLQIPAHLNLKTITRLKDQNRQLTQEVSDCSHRVTQLETEKAMLLRQLFHQKTNLHNSDETVYM